MTIIKTVTAGAAALCIATSAMAGGLLEPEVRPEIQIITPEQTGGSLPGWVIPAVIVAALIGVAAAAEDDSATAGDGTAG